MVNSSIVVMQEKETGFGREGPMICQPESVRTSAVVEGPRTKNLWDELR